MLQSDVDYTQHRGHHSECPIIGHGYSGDGQLVATVAPDFGAIDADLGWQEPGEPEPEQARENEIQTAVDALGAIASWIGSSDTLTSAGLRGLAIAHLLGRTEAKSGAELASAFGVSRQNLSKFISELRIVLAPSFRAPGLRDNKERQLRRQIALDAHAKQGEQTRIEICSYRGRSQVLVPPGGGALAESVVNRLTDALGPRSGWKSPQAKIIQSRTGVIRVWVRSGPRRKLKAQQHEAMGLVPKVTVAFSFGGTMGILRVPREPGVIVYPPCRSAAMLKRYGANPEAWHSKEAEFDTYRGRVRCRLKF